MKNLAQVILLCMVSLWLFGCGPKTTGKDIDVRNTFNITNNTGRIIVSPDLATQSGDTEQDVVAPTTTTNDVPLDLTIPLSSSADALQGAIEKTTADKIKDAAVDITPEVTEPEVVPEVEGNELLTEIGNWSMGEFTRTPGNLKSSTRLPVDFNKHDYPVKFVFDNGCGEFTIPTANAEFDKYGKEGYYFHKFHKGSPVVFTEAGCVASKVTAYK